MWHLAGACVDLSCRSENETLCTMRQGMFRRLLGLGMIFETASFKAGESAFNDGIRVTDNPHHRNSRMWSDWELGWRTASNRALVAANQETAIVSPDMTAFDLGKAAAASGQGAVANPYLQGHPAHEEWRIGWASAKAA